VFFRAVDVFGSAFRAVEERQMNTTSAIQAVT